MPICLNDKTKTYKGTEPSPKGLGYCAHSEKLGTKKVGLEGKWWWIVKSINDIKKWVKLTPISDNLDDLSSLVYGQNIEKQDIQFIQNSTQKAQNYVEKCYALKNILANHDIETIIVFNEFDEESGVFWADYPTDVINSYLEKKYKKPPL